MALTDWTSGQQPTQPTGTTSTGGGLKDWLDDDATKRDRMGGLSTRNLGGTGNALNSAWAERAQKFDDRVPSSDVNRWKDKEATGIALWSDEEDGVQAGDVYDQGRKIGKVEDFFTTQAEADQYMLGRYMTSEQQAKLFRSSDYGPEKLRQTVQDLQGAYSGEVANRRTSIATQERQQAIDDRMGPWDNLLGVAASTAAGVGLGALTGGLPGAAIGFLGGLGSGLLSWDKQGDIVSGTIDRVHQAWAPVEGTQSGYGIPGLDQIGAAARSIGEVSSSAFQEMNVFQNAVQGLRDVTTSGWDGNFTYASVNPETGQVEVPRGWQVASLLAAVGDGALQFGRTGAAKATMGVIGGMTLPEMAAMLTTGRKWDDSSGTYNDLWRNADGDIDVTRMAAAQASELLNFGSAALLGRLAGVRPAGEVTREAAALGATGAVEARGWRFYTDAQGNLIEGAGRDFVASSLLNPFEAAGAVTTKALAVRAQRLQQGATTALTTRALYNEATRIGTGTGRLAIGIQSALAEGWEEVAQQALDTYSLDQEQRAEDLVNAFVFGVAGGFGGSLPSVLRMPSRDERELQKAQALAKMRGIPEPASTVEEWRKLGEDQRRRALQSTSTQDLVLEAVDSMAARDLDLQVASLPAAARARDLAEAAEASAYLAASPTANVSSMLTIRHTPSSLAPDGTVIGDAPVYAETMSMDTYVARFQSRARMMREIVQQLTQEVTTDPEKQEALDRAKRLQNGSDLLEQLVTDGWSNATQGANPQQLVQALRQLNTYMRGLFEGTSPQPPAFLNGRAAYTPEQQDDMAQALQNAVGTRSPQDNPGSLFILLPWLDPEFIRMGAKGVIGVAPEFLKSASADSDGDMLRVLMGLVLDPQDVEGRIRGAVGMIGQVGKVDSTGNLSGKLEVTIEATSVDINRARWMSEAAGASATSQQRAFYEETLARIQRALAQIVPDQALQRAMIQGLRQAYETGAEDPTYVMFQGLRPEQLIGIIEAAQTVYPFHQIAHAISAGMAYHAAETTAINAQRSRRINRDLVSREAAVTPPIGRTQDRPAIRDTTVGADASLRERGYDFLRQAMKMNFAAPNSTSVDAKDLLDADPEVQLLFYQELYRAVSRGLDQTGEEQRTKANHPVKLALEALEALANDVLGPYHLNSAYGNVAALMSFRMSDVTITGPDGEAQLGDGRVSLVQMALRLAAAKLREANSAVLLPGSTQQKQLDRIESLAYGEENIDAAAREVLGSLSLYEVLGDTISWSTQDGVSASMLPPSMTVDGAVRFMSALRVRDRRNLEYELRHRPEHEFLQSQLDPDNDMGLPLQASVLAHRNIVAFLAQQANGVITASQYDSKGRWVRPGGTLGDADLRTLREFDERHTAAQSALRAFLASRSKSDPIHQQPTWMQMRALIESNSILSSAFYKTITDTHLGQLITWSTDGSMVSPVFYEALADPDSRRGFARLWRAQTYSELRTEIAKQSLRDSNDQKLPKFKRQILEIFSRLRSEQPELFAEGWKIVETMNDIDELTEWVNETPGVLQGNPWLPTQDLTSQFNPWITTADESAKSTSQEAADLRALAKAFADYRPSLSTLADDMAESLEWLTGPAARKHTAKVDALIQIARANALGETGDPQFAHDVVFSVLQQIQANSHSKGQNRPQIEPQGAMDRLRRRSGKYQNELLYALDEVVGSSEFDISNPYYLVEPRIIHLADGSVIDWPGLTRDTLIAGMSNPNTYRLFMRMMSPPIYSVSKGTNGLVPTAVPAHGHADEVNRGARTLQQLSGFYDSVANFTADADSAFESGRQAEVFSTQMRMVLSRTDQHNEQFRNIAALAILREYASPTLMDADDVAKNIRRADTDRTRALVAAAQFVYAQASAEELATMSIDDLLDKAQVQLKQVRDQLITDAPGRGADLTDDEVRITLLNQQMSRMAMDASIMSDRLIEQAQAGAISPDQVAATVEAYLNDNIAAVQAITEDELDRSVLTRFARQQALEVEKVLLDLSDTTVPPMFADRAEQRHYALQRLLANPAAAARVIDAGRVLDSIRRQLSQRGKTLQDITFANSEDWEMVGNAAIALAYSTAQQPLDTRREIRPYPGAKDKVGRSLYDLSHGYVLDAVLDRQSPELRAALEIVLNGTPPTEPMTSQRLKSVLRTSIWNQDFLPEWDTAVVDRVLGAKSILDPAAAPQGIASAGSTPSMSHALVASSTRRTDTPTQGLSSVKVRVADIPTTYAGMFRTPVEITHPDGRVSKRSWAHIHHSYIGSATSTGGTIPGALTTAFIDVPALAGHALSALGPDGVVELTFQDAESVGAASDVHNVRVEGVGPLGDLDSAPSIFATDPLIPGGIDQLGSRRALDSIKKGWPAIARIMSVAKLDDSAGVLTALANAANQLTSDAQGALVGPHAYKYIYALLKKHVVLSTTTADGVERFMGVDEYLIRQHTAATNLDLAVTVTAMNLLSHRELLTLLGDPRGNGLPEFSPGTDVFDPRTFSTLISYDAPIRRLLPGFGTRADASLEPLAAIAATAAPALRGSSVDRASGMAEYRKASESRNKLHRAITNERDRVGDSAAARQLQRGEKAAELIGAAGSKMRMQGSDTVSMAPKLNSRATKLLAKLQEQTIQENLAVWVLDPSMPTPDNNRIQDTQFVNDASRPLNRISPREAVVVMLSGYSTKYGDDYVEARKALQGDLDQLIRTGAPIILVGDGDFVLRETAQSYLNDSGQYADAGNTAGVIFVPAVVSAETWHNRAEQSMLRHTAAFDFNEMEVYLTSWESDGFGGSTYYNPDSPPSSNGSYGNAPFSPVLEGFGRIPDGPDERAVVEALKDLLSTKSGRKFLLARIKAQPIGGDADPEAVLDRLEERVNRGHLLPAAGDVFSADDVLVYFDAVERRIYLKQMAHRDSESAAAVEFAQRAPSSGPAGSWKFAGSSPEIDGGLSFARGEVIVKSVDNIGGGRRQLVTINSHSVIGTLRYQQHGGEKTVVSSEAPNSLLAILGREPLFASGYTWHEGANIDDTISKQSTPGRGITARVMTALFGFDLYEDALVPALSVGGQAPTRDIINTLVQQAKTRFGSLDLASVASILQSSDPLEALSLPLIGNADAAAWLRSTVGASATAAFSDLSAEARVTIAALVYLSATNTSLNDIAYTPGATHPQALTPGTNGFFLANEFTQIFDYTPTNDLHLWLVQKLNRRWGADPTAERGRIITPGFEMEAWAPVNGKRRAMRWELNLVPRVVAKHPQDVGSGRSSERADLSAAEATNALVFGTGRIFTGQRTAEKLRSLRDRAAGGSRLAVQDATAATTAASFDDAGRLFLPTQTARSGSPLEQMAEDIALDFATRFRHLIDMSDWSADEVRQFRHLQSAVLQELHLGPESAYEHFIHFGVRQIQGRPFGLDENGRPYPIVAAEAIEAVNLMLAAVKEHRYPVSEGAVPFMFQDFVTAIKEANENRPIGRQWLPRVSTDLSEPLIDNTDSSQWHDAAVGQFMSLTPQEGIRPMWFSSIDGVYAGYKASMAGQGLVPLGSGSHVLDRVLDRSTGRPVVSLEAYRRKLLSNPVIFSEGAATAQQRAGLVDSLIAQHYSQLGEGTATGFRRAVQDAAFNDADLVQQKTSPRLALNEGVEALGHRKRVSIFARAAMAWTVVKTFTNPGMYASIFAELATIRASTSLTNAAMGTPRAVNAQNRRLLLATDPAALPRTFLGKRIAAVSRAAQSIPVVAAIAPRVTKAMTEVWTRLGDGRLVFQGSDAADMQNAVTALATSQKAQREFASELFFDNAEGFNGLRSAQRGLRGLVASMNDLSYKLISRGLPNSYITAVSEWVLTHPESGASVSSVMAAIVSGKGMDYVRLNLPEAHLYGMYAARERRGMNDHITTTIRRAILNPLNSNGLTALAAMPLTVMTAFSGFTMNTMSRMLGLNTLNSLAYALTEGSRVNPIFKAFRNALTGTNEGAREDEIITHDHAVGALDVVRAMVQDGVSHTALVVLGSALGGLDFAGDDDELKRLRKENRYIKTLDSFRWDGSENRLEDAGAWDVDWLPFGIENFFESADGVHRIQPNWILRTFLSPVVGIQKWQESGDITDLWTGFTDAFSAVPYGISLTVRNMWDTAAELQASAAEASARGESTEAVGLFMRSIMVLERTLLEHPLINAIYTGDADSPMPDPWALPLRNPDGSFVRDSTNVVQETNDLTSYAVRDAEGNLTGESAVAYRDRTQQDGFLHSLTANNFILASLMNIKAWAFGGQGDYLRGQMPGKTTTEDLPVLDYDSSEALFAAAIQANGIAIPDYTPSELETQARNILYNQGTGWVEDSQVTALATQLSEQAAMWPQVIDADTAAARLSDPGVVAIIGGLAKGTLDFNSPTLAGLVIDNDTRERIQATWTQYIVDQGVEEIGLTPSKAADRAQRIWYEKGPTGLSMYDLLWNDDTIPRTGRVEYRYLNGTSIPGPNGTLVATGYTKPGIMQLFGLLPGNGMFTRDQTGLSMDETGSAVDDVYGINTGKRGITRITQPVTKPDDPSASIAKTVSAGVTYDSSAAFGSSGGGSSRSSGYSTGRGYLMDVPYYRAYWDDLPNIYLDNITLRRASVRRERVWSERGRLKQWQ